MPSSEKPANQVPSDPLYASREKRLCVRCGLKKHYECFARTASGEASKFCRDCEATTKAEQNAKAATTAISNVAKHISAAMLSQKAENPHLGHCLSLVLEQLHARKQFIGNNRTPMESLAKLMVDEIERVFDADLPPSRHRDNLRLKYLSMLQNSMGTLLRHDDDFDPSQLDQAEVQDSLKYVGIEALRNDPALLKSVLKDMGITVIDTAPTETEPGLAAIPPVPEGAGTLPNLP